MPTAIPTDADDAVDLAPRLDRAAVLREVARGLPNEKERLAGALENQRFADLKGDAYLERRDGESASDYERRPKKTTGFLHQVLNRLTAHTYNPGPRRRVSDPALDAILQQVYAQNHIDSLMHEAERLATVNDVAAIQVRWTGGRTPDRPIDLQLWGSEEFAVFESPDDPRIPEAVVTIDRVNATTRYRVWFDDLVHTFSTVQAGGASGRQTAGGVIAFELPGSPAPNPYGVLPFAFFHYRPPIRQFWTDGPGSFLRQTEMTANREISELAEAIMNFTVPVAILKNVGPEFNPTFRPGSWMRLMRGGPSYSGDGFADAGEPDASFLQAELAIEQVWQDVRHTLDQAAEACDLPPGALQLDYADAPSGFSIVARNFPLYDRAKQRRPVYQRAECDLIRVIGAVHAARTGQAQIAAVARTATITLSWPEPRIPVPGPDRDETDAWEINLGITSRLQVIERRYGLGRDQALEHLRQVADDETEARAILPEPEHAPPAAGDPAAQAGNASGSQSTDATDD